MYVEKQRLQMVPVCGWLLDCYWWCNLTQMKADMSWSHSQTLYQNEPFFKTNSKFIPVEYSNYVCIHNWPRQFVFIFWTPLYNHLFLLDCHVSCLLNLGLFQEVLIKAPSRQDFTVTHAIISSSPLLNGQLWNTALPCLIWGRCEMILGTWTIPVNSLMGSTGFTHSSG